MTKETKTAPIRALKRFENMVFFRDRFSMLHNYLLASENGDSTGDKMKKNVNPSVYQKYNFDALFSASNVLECLDQINYSIEMLSGYNQRNALFKNRHDYIIFMLENFYLRITSIMDRILRFVNTVFEIGIPDRECKNSTIIKNENVKKTPLYKILTKMDKFIEQYRPQRNRIAHYEAYSEKELVDLQGYYLLLEHAEEVDEELESYRRLFKVETDEYVINKKKELRQISKDLEKMLVVLFQEIFPIVENKGAKYKVVKNNKTNLNESLE